MQNALQAVAERSRGAVIYLRQEGRGIGLGDKVRAYAEQDRGADTVEANRAIGLPVDLRDFRAAAAILKAHGVTRVRINTNNPDKVTTFEECGLAVAEVIGSHCPPNAHNLDYLRTKMSRMGHQGLQHALDQLAPTETGILGSNAEQESTPLVIFDLDGVIQMGDAVPDEAVALVEGLRAHGLTLRFLTNDGINSRAVRSEMLRQHGLEVDPEHIYTGASLTARFLHAHAPGPVLLLGGGTAREEFQNLDLVSENAETVVVGDFFGHYDPALLQAAYDSLHRGARLVAVHRKRTWPIDGTRRMDLGFWVAGLEYCAERPAAIIGKPSAYAYRAVLEDTGTRASDAIMISDEFDPDLAGALRCGIHSLHFQPDHAEPIPGVVVAATYEAVRKEVAEFLERRFGVGTTPS